MLSTSVWLGLKKETRDALAKQFQLSKSGNVEVVNNQVVSDGYSINDLLGITLEKLKEFTGNNSDDFYFQFNKVVNFIEGKGMEISAASVTPQVEPTIEEVKPKRKYVRKTKSK